MNSEAFQTIMILLGKSQSEEDVLMKLKDSIAEYELTKSEKARSTFTFNLMLASSKFLTEGKDMKEVMDDLDKSRRGHDLLNATTN